MNDFNVFMDELPLWSAPFGLALLDTLRFRKHATVLDIGCGEGFPVIEIASRFGPTCQCIGLDPLFRPLTRLGSKNRCTGCPVCMPCREWQRHCLCGTVRRSGGLQQRHQ